MSINLHVGAGKTQFDLCQTSTDETYAILSEPNHYDAYCEWLRGRDDDPDYYAEHMAKLRSFLNKNRTARFYAA